ncbi:thiol:disulfide interchange protein [Luteibacter rhizovicinus DSM 16549]|jgi:cytochrome c biogenesis protein CcmG/thiol:disulfide interchange protein DsbE|uniref:Thiol:disulfide interchange protein n=1 Tax=Luteibacter rhizovicinus DSM 16549 TaxID=1440763 RepID=A0A0G9HJV8_9GAMM|nr:DsbE family thiol:disulfide interchange protein [Luteibacter rhizovicinus]APG05364.1 thiol:disulfide interchange protein [Luteibacter rhizovicinus DSM 16549]KLD67982.1 thiol:disulfide interchange protein [Luteibacter rhizovicinus DSM 16549]KLD79615.1 thiol:disulfide interchange protein [Xanthomonas hyacinthi DSM 19077]
MSRLLPLFGFLVLVGLFGFGIWWNTQHDQHEIVSPLIDKPAPAFALPVLDDAGRTVSKASLLGKPYFLNVFASWCIECVHEHPLLMTEVKQLGLPLVGFNYKDDPQAATAWLAEHGNPFDVIVADREGRSAIDFGVYAAPETFLVDAKGVIRYKRIGPITPEVIDREIRPALAALAKEAP